MITLKIFVHIMIIQRYFEVVDKLLSVDIPDQQRDKYKRYIAIIIILLFYKKIFFNIFSDSGYLLIFLNGFLMFDDLTSILHVSYSSFVNIGLSMIGDLRKKNPDVCKSC